MSWLKMISDLYNQYVAFKSGENPRNYKGYDRIEIEDIGGVENALRKMFVQ